MIEPKDDLELLMARVEQMRGHQRDYFARKTQTDKKLSIELEKQVDELIRQLRRRGYNPERFKTNTYQKGLF
jgi:hypothetical protein